jgi:hypothetical protein
MHGPARVICEQGVQTVVAVSRDGPWVITAGGEFCQLATQTCGDHENIQGPLTKGHLHPYFYKQQTAGRRARRSIRWRPRIRGDSWLVHCSVFIRQAAVRFSQDSNKVAVKSIVGKRLVGYPGM